MTRSRRISFVFAAVAVLAAAWGLPNLTSAVTSAADPAAESAPDSTPGDAPLTAPEPFRAVSLTAFPERITLEGPFSYRQLLITAIAEDGRKLDVTREAEISGAAALVSISENGLVSPLADGAGELVLTARDQEVRIPFEVRNFNVPFHADFVRDVAPVLSKLGCNAGTCHGAAAGKNGFKLSLRGYDPEFDHRALVDDLAGRRFNRAAPDQSLMLLKPSGGAPHVGGVLTHPGEPYYAIIRNWIAGGVELNLHTPRVVKIALYPENPRIELPGDMLQMAVIATYADGSTRDVTREAFVDSSLGEVITVDKLGLATAVRRGEAAFLARYEGSYASQPVVVMGDRTGFVWRSVPEFNKIDTLIYNKLKDVKIQPSDVCNDEEFVRRVYLDLTGAPPTPEIVRAFTADERERMTKRNKLIDHLIGSPEFVEYWTNKWADMLQVNRKFLGERGAWAYRDWIREAIASNMPYDKFAYEVLTASGSTLENPPASYYKSLRTPEELVENTTQLFLATRFNCNKCHDHPFERWTQDQYYQLAAYFAQVERKDEPEFKDDRIGGTAVEGAKAAVEVVYDSNSGDMVHARTGFIAQPHFPYEHSGRIPEDASRRQQLASWIATADNPYFAKSYVNRLWSYLLGRGLIDPVDDIRAGNPPSNPELLEYLTEEFVSSGFDSRHVLRLICQSRVYQHSLRANEWNADDTINFSHALPRRLPAEALYDAIHVATGTKPKLPGMPDEFRAVELPDSEVQLDDGFFQLFGKPPRESACECERTSDVMLGPVLNLINGPTVAEAIAAPNNRLQQLAAQFADDKQLVREVYLAILCKTATDAEVELGLQALQGYAREGELLRADLAAYTADQFPQRFAAWVASAKPGPTWQVLKPLSAAAESGVPLTIAADGTITAGGTAPDKDTYTLEFEANVTAAKALRLEALADDALPARGPGRAPNGNFVVSHFDLEIAKPGADYRAHRLNDASATFEQGGFKALNALGGFDPQRGWAIHPEMGKSQTAAFQARSDFGHPDGPTRLRVTIRQAYGGAHVLGKFRLSISESERPVKVEAAKWPAEINTILLKPAESHSPEELQRLVEYYQTQDQGYASRKAQLDVHAASADQARLRGAQDLAWALINSPAFLFNR